MPESDIITAYLSDSGESPAPRSSQEVIRSADTRGPRNAFPCSVTLRGPAVRWLENSHGGRSVGRPAGGGVTGQQSVTT
jgi:hypothetical protein